MSNFNILNHLNILQVIRETPSQIECLCPMCDSPNFKIRKKDGAYSSYGCDCAPRREDGIGEGLRKEIRELLSPSNWGAFSEEQKQEFLLQKQKEREYKKQQESEKRKSWLDEDERHINIVKIIEQLKLSVEHRESLKQRGLTDEQIDKANYRTVVQWQQLKGINRKLPGINSKGNLNSSGKGILCPIPNKDGLYIGMQLRLDFTATDERYKWLSSPKQGYSPRLKNGELPIAVYNMQQSEVVALTEGISFKPYIASIKLNVPVIGASGGQFAGSREQIKSILEAAKASKVILYPDAGSILNNNVLHQYQAIYELISEWGYQFAVAWWEQVEKNHNDIDEIGDLTEIKVKEISFKDFMKKKPKKDAEVTDEIDNKPKKEGKKTAGKTTKHQQAFSPSNHWKSVEDYNYEMGYWNEKELEDGTIDKYFVPRADFIIKVKRILADNNGGGLVLEVQQKTMGRIKVAEAIVNSSEQMRSIDFHKAITKGLKTSISSKLTNDEIQALLKRKRDEYKDGEYTLCDRVGCQENGIWVFPDRQFDANGNEIKVEQSKMVFNPHLSPDDYVPVPEIAPYQPQALQKLFIAMKKFLGSNFERSLFALGFVAASVHYQKIMKIEKCFPIMNIYGDPGSNKSIIAECALSLLGSNWPEMGMFTTMSESALFERLKNLGGLANCYDDPTKGSELDEITKKLYGGVPREVRGNHQKPHSALILTSNYAIGDESSAARRRLFRFSMPVVKDGQKNAYPELRQAQLGVSCILPELIKIGYDSLAISQIESILIEYLNNAHPSLAKTLAQVTYYTEKLCQMGGLEFNVMDYMKLVICKENNDASDNRSSLEDFLDKVAILRGDSKLGNWNLKEFVNIDLEDGKEIKSGYLALHLTSVWQTVEKNFKTIYSQTVIKSLIEEAGGKTQNQVRKFDLDMKSSQAKEMNELKGDDMADPPQVNKRCVLIPIELWEKHLSKNTDIDDDIKIEANISNNKEPKNTSTDTKEQIVSIDENCINEHYKDYNNMAYVQEQINVGDLVVFKQICYWVQKIEGSRYYLGAYDNKNKLMANVARTEIRKYKV